MICRASWHCDYSKVGAEVHRIKKLLIAMIAEWLFHSSEIKGFVCQYLKLIDISIPQKHEGKDAQESSY